MIVIDNNSYDVPVLSVTRKADFLDKYAERTEDGVLHRELIGVYFNYQIRFGTTSDAAEYELLWNKLTEPEEFHEIIIIDTDGGEHAFTAYFSNVADEYRRVIPNPLFGQPGEEEYKSYFQNLTVNFISKSPTRS